MGVLKLANQSQHGDALVKIPSIGEAYHRASIIPSTLFITGLTVHERESWWVNANVPHVQYGIVSRRFEHVLRR